mmetsp:Transcript_5849/g.17280  ORF Transcript_5849/g.17280 Transcript_5849/m.17280 type:complete len:135 (-) Transcript_5849:39-443(-)
MPSPKMLVIVGSSEPLYEADFAPSEENEKNAHLSHFILHASLDMVDDKMAEKTDCYLRIVDRFNEQNVFAFVTPGYTKFLLLHDGKNEEAVRHFFLDVFEHYVKMQMNPFYKEDMQITSKPFDKAVHAAARRYL